MDYAPPQKGKNKSKGKGKSKGKPGNKGKGKTPHLNNQASRGGNKQAATDPKGNQFCNNWMRGRCPGNCGRTHKCNLILAMGRICLGDHLPQDCPGSLGALTPSPRERGANAPSRHRSPLLQVSRALTQGGTGQVAAILGGRRQNQRAQRPRRDQNSHTTGTTAAPQSRATGAEGPDMAGTGWFPAGAEGPDTGGRTQKARVPDDWQHTATPRDTPRKQPIPLPAPNIIKQDPVVFHKSSVGLNEGGQRLSAPDKSNGAVTGIGHLPVDGEHP